MTPYYETELGKLYHGGCLEIMPGLEPVDLVLTDPPYGINYDVSHKKYKNGKNWGEIKWDSEIFDPAHLVKLQKPTIIWGGNCFSSRLPDSTAWLCWVKIDKNNTNIRQSEIELAWTNCINRSMAYRIQWIGAGMEGECNAVYGGTVHPTQKPIALMIWCIEKSKSKGVVLDPYLGSGTTAIACERLNRKWIGIEIEEKYCEIAAKRIELERKQLKLF